MYRECFCMCASVCVWLRQPSIANAFVFVLTVVVNAEKSIHCCCQNCWREREFSEFWKDTNRCNWIHFGKFVWSILLISVGLVHLMWVICSSFWLIGASVWKIEAIDKQTHWEQNRNRPGRQSFFYIYIFLFVWQNMIVWKSSTIFLALSHLHFHCGTHPLRPGILCSDMTPCHHASHKHNGTQRLIDN